MRSHRINGRASLLLVGVNLLVFNLLIAPANAARLDLTQNSEYSLSDVTRLLLGGLQEPLLIRGYFSEQSHPLLAPLVPRIKDTLREYELAARGMMEVEFIDPLTNPEMEREANQVFGIRPTPLQVQDRGGVSLVNVYFDVLIAYGDQTTTLHFSDLIEIGDSISGVEVRLRNLEYDLTSSIQRAVYGFQSLDAVLDSFDQPAELTLFVSSATLPEFMREAGQMIEDVTSEIVASNPEKAQFEVVDMSSADVGLTEQDLFDLYQIQPVATSFFALETFYLHLVVQLGDSIQVVYPSGELSQNEVRSAIEAALKRLSPGFLKVIGLWTPPAQGVDQFGRQMPSLQQYSILEDTLRESYELRRLTLDEAGVPGDIDVLILIAPHDLSDRQRYAIDQFVMRGGSLIVAGSHYRLGIDQFQGTLALEANESGIEDLLLAYGIDIGDSLIMDLQNAPFPLQVQRDLGDMVVTEVQALDYPFFVDVRPDGLAADNSVVDSLPFVTMNWASPVMADDALLDSAAVTTLIRSSASSWQTFDNALQPDLETYPNLGFPIGEEQESFPLAIAVEGSFESYFIDEPSPFEVENAGESEAVESPPAAESIGKIEQSPDNTRLVVVGSSEFVNDNVYQISLNFGGDRFASNLQLIANAIDWFTEDVSLASIRSRGSITRILPAIPDAAQSQWVVMNYAVALIGLFLIGAVWQLQRRAEQPLPLVDPTMDANSSANGIEGEG